MYEKPIANQEKFSLWQSLRQRKLARVALVKEIDDEIEAYKKTPEGRIFTNINGALFHSKWRNGSNPVDKFHIPYHVLTNKDTSTVYSTVRLLGVNGTEAGIPDKGLVSFICLRAKRNISTSDMQFMEHSSDRLYFVTYDESNLSGTPIEINKELIASASEEDLELWGKAAELVCDMEIGASKYLREPVDYL